MISITNPIQPAIAHTRRLLFEPFRAKTWFLLGFTAFLAHLAEGGSSFNYNNPFKQTRGGPDFDGAFAWMGEHLPLVITLIALAFVLLLALSILFLWLSSRGQFMFLEGVARTCTEIAEPWTRFRDLGNQLFAFRVKVLLVAWGAFIIVGGMGVLLALPDIRARHFGLASILALVVAGGLLLLALLALGLVTLLLRDFVVPLMYQRNIGTTEAWSLLRRELLPGHGWSFVGFYLMNLLLGLGSALLMLLGCCLTCCLALLPYLSSVVFLPIHVFFRCYSLKFLEQFGEEWRILQGPANLD